MFALAVFLHDFFIKLNRSEILQLRDVLLKTKFNEIMFLTYSWGIFLMLEDMYIKKN